LWRHGGVVFGPQPRDWSLKLTKKVKALAFRKALSDRMAAGDVMVVDEMKLGTSKTKDFVSVLRNLKLVDDTLLVSSEMDENLTRASRNVSWVEVTQPNHLNVYQLVRHDHIVFTASAFESMTQRLTGSAKR
jgi:large subunit ribosomal protein L4